MAGMADMIRDSAMTAHPCWWTVLSGTAVGRGSAEAKLQLDRQRPAAQSLVRRPGFGRSLTGLASLSENLG